MAHCVFLTALYAVDYRVVQRRWRQRHAISKSKCC